jgi:DNA-binding NarL/FixJ family response regulator
MRKQLAVISGQVDEVAERVLSDEEEQALKLLAFGHTNTEIAAELGITEEQAKAMIHRISERLGAASEKRDHIAVIKRGGGR